MAKRKFAGGNPFVSRKKYKGTLFQKRQYALSGKATAAQKKALIKVQRKYRKRVSYASFSAKGSANQRLKRTFGKKKARTILGAVREAQKDQNVSTYRKKLFGDFNPMWFYNAGTSVGIPIGKKHFFGHFKKQTNATPYTQYACEFSAFTPEKLMDACSVLYGGKAAAANHEETEDNMPNSTIAHFVYARQSFEMHNLSVRCYDMKIYELHNIGGKHSTAPCFDINASIGSHLWVSAPTATVAAGNGELYIDDAFELSDLKMKNWKIAKVMKLAAFKPGQTFSWTATLKHKTVNFEKYVSTGNALTPYGPGTITYVIEAQTIPQLLHTATAADTTYGRTTPTNDTGQSFGFRTQQVYKIGEPENVADANEGVKTALFTDASNGPAQTWTGVVDKFTRMANVETYTTAGV